MAIAKKVAIYGSGPAGLMAASRLLEVDATLEVQVFERRPSLGRKLLIAGSSGLNISHDTPIDDFITHYEGFTPELWKRWFNIWSPEDWIQWVQKLGFETFVGTSSRYFVREMKAAGILRAWTQQLETLGVRFHPNHEWKTLDELKGYDAVGFFLGGGSWEDTPPRWPKRFESELGVTTIPFQAANVGYEVNWNAGLLAEAEGKPLKNIVLKVADYQKAGELVITQYGLEGTPIYFLGRSGRVALDLKPSMSRDQIVTKLKAVTENLAPMRRIQKQLQLCDATQALLFHQTTSAQKADLEQMIGLLKNFPIDLLASRPLVEAISSRGGVALSEIETAPGRELSLKKHPIFFCGGEMLDWTAPTGGFLIQGCITQGAVVAKNILKALGSQ